MKALKCEMCGSVELLKEDGVYVCQHCRTSYSVEEAKKLMVEIEGTVEVKGTVKVDNTDKVGNYWTLANDAFEAGENKQAETYCNKILEIEEEHYEAYALKAKAVAWQSTLAKVRLDDAKNLYEKAIKFVPEDKKIAFKEEIVTDFNAVCNAMIKQATKTFAGNSSKDMTDTCLAAVYTSLLNRGLLSAACGKPAIDKEYTRSVWRNLGSAAVEASNAAFKEYKADTWPSKYDWETYTDKLFGCIKVTEKAIDELAGQTASLITLYKNLILFTDKRCNAVSYTHNGYGYVVDVRYTKDAKRTMRNYINGYHQKLAQLDPTYKAPAKPVERRTWMAVMSLVLSLLMFCVTVAFCIVNASEDMFAMALTANLVYLFACIFNFALLIVKSYSGTEKQLAINWCISLIFYIITSIFFFVAGGVVNILGGGFALLSAALMYVYQTWKIKY